MKRLLVSVLLVAPSGLLVAADVDPVVRRSELQAALTGSFGEAFNQLAAQNVGLERRVVAAAGRAEELSGEADRHFRDAQATRTDVGRVRDQAEAALRDARGVQAAVQAHAAEHARAMGELAQDAAAREQTMRDAFTQEAGMLGRTVRETLGAAERVFKDEAAGQRQAFNQASTDQRQALEASLGQHQAQIKALLKQYENTVKQLKGALETSGEKAADKTSDAIREGLEAGFEAQREHQQDLLDQKINRIGERVKKEAEARREVLTKNLTMTLTPEEQEQAEKAAIQRRLIEVKAESAARTQDPELFKKLNEEQAKIQEDAARIAATIKWDSIKQIAANMGEGLKDKQRMAIIGATIAGTAGSVYGIRLAMRQLEKYLNRPRLVRDTSKRSLLRRLFGKRRTGPVFSDMILAPALEKKLRRVMESATMAYKFGTNLPNVGLFGPPGTGKTMFIEALANESGMTFAKMTGGDVSALLSSGGENVAVTEIHKLFDWLEANGPAVLLVDEADAFLKNGRDGTLSEGLTAAINAFLSRTGSSSNKVMVVFATNYPQALDGAVQNRVSTWVHVGRPSQIERRRLLLHLIQSLRKNGLGRGRDAVDTELFTDDVADRLASRMKGFAGRDIKMKFMDALERHLVRTQQRTVTREMVNEVLDETMENERELARWKAGERPDFDGIGQAIAQES